MEEVNKGPRALALERSHDKQVRAEFVLAFITS